MIARWSASPKYRPRPDTRLTIQGTRDPAAWLTVPAAVDFARQQVRHERADVGDEPHLDLVDGAGALRQQQHGEGGVAQTQTEDAVAVVLDGEPPVRREVVMMVHRAHRTERW